MKDNKEKNLTQTESLEKFQNNLDNNQSHSKTESLEDKNAQIEKELTNQENSKTENLDSEDAEEKSKEKNKDLQKIKKSRCFTAKLDNYFKMSKRGSSIKQEFIGGLVNFLVLSYILVVIPGLFNGISTETMWRALFLATILTTVISTICMAFCANLPIVLAPGIGLTSYVVQLVDGGQYTFGQVMALCFIAGVAFLLLTLTGLRKKIVNSIPLCVKVGLPAGVGLFILNIGLSSSNSGLLDMLNGTATSFAPIVALVSFIIMTVLYIKKVKGGIFIGIIAGTVLDIILKFCYKINPFECLTTNSWVPPFKEMFESTLFNFDFAGLFSGNVLSSILSVILVVFAIVLIDMFDTVGTLYATAEKGNLLNEKGEVINMNRAMLIDGCGAMVSSCMGIPNATSYVESTAGIASGARTGLSVLFTSLFFILAMFISPLVMVIPVYATAPALILVGLIMFDGVLKIDFKDLSSLIPSALTIIIMPLSNNITFGIAAGLISYTLINLFTGKPKKVNVLTYVMSVLFILYFIVQYI